MSNILYGAVWSYHAGLGFSSGVTPADGYMLRNACLYISASSGTVARTVWSFFSSPSHHISNERTASVTRLAAACFIRFSSKLNGTDTAMAVRSDPGPMKWFISLSIPFCLRMLDIFHSLLITRHP